MRPTAGFWLPERVRRHAEKHHRAALRQVERQLGKLRRLDERDAVLGQQVVDHARVLHADERAEHAQHAGRHPEVEADAVGVARARAGAGADDHLVAAEVGDDLVDEREHRRAAAVDDALAADLDDVGLGQDPYRRLVTGPRQQLLAGERAVDQRLSQLGQK